MGGRRTSEGTSLRGNRLANLGLTEQVAGPACSKFFYHSAQHRPFKILKRCGAVAAKPIRARGRYLRRVSLSATLAAVPYGTGETADRART